MKSAENPYWHRYLLTDPSLVAKVIQEEHIISRGLRLHLDVYQREDSSPTILFVPGTGAHARCYAEFLFQLHGQGFRVVGIDLQGLPAYEHFSTASADQEQEPAATPH